MRELNSLNLFIFKLIINDDSTKTKSINPRLGIYFSVSDSFATSKSISATARHLGNNIYFSHFEFKLYDVNINIDAGGVAAINIAEFIISSASGFLRVDSLHGNGVQYQTLNHYICIRKEDGQLNQSIVGSYQSDTLILNVILV